MDFPIEFENSVIYGIIIKIHVRDAMCRTLHTLSKDDLMLDAKVLMKRESITGIPIVDGERLVGLVSVDDIIDALDSGNMETPLKELMTTDIISLEEDMPLTFAISYINKYRYGRFPVVDSARKLVGILTSSDIIKHLLLEMNNEILNLEEQLEKIQDHPTVGRVEKTFICPQYDMNRAGKASTEIKKILKEFKIDKKVIRRIAVAAYELEINIVVHSLGGTMFFSLDDEKAHIIARDKGPGIPDPEKALTEGFSTANEWVRSHGFGAGMGLPNVKRVSDGFSLVTDTRHGTVVKAVINLGSKEGNDENQ